MWGRGTLNIIQSSLNISFNMDTVDRKWLRSKLMKSVTNSPESSIDDISACSLLQIKATRAKMKLKSLADAHWTEVLTGKRSRHHLPLYAKFSYPTIKTTQFQTMMEEDHQLLIMRQKKYKDRYKSAVGFVERPADCEPLTPEEARRKRSKDIIRKNHKRLRYIERLRDDKWKKRRIREHLAESIDVNNDFVVYEVQFPYRVAVRLQFLMGSSKAQITDNDYMKDLYNKLVLSEDAEIYKRSQIRNKNELHRVKNLVLDGKMDAPESMESLENHPVFRVKYMLDRIAKTEEHKLSNKFNITPVEPYEYDLGKFFRHLHKTGEVWKPSPEELRKCLLIQKAKKLLEHRHLTHKEKSRFLKSFLRLGGRKSIVDFEDDICPSKDQVDEGNQEILIEQEVRGEDDDDVEEIVEPKLDPKYLSETDTEDEAHAFVEEKQFEKEVDKVSTAKLKRSVTIVDLSHPDDSPTATTHTYRQSIAKNIEKADSLEDIDMEAEQQDAIANMNIHHVYDQMDKLNRYVEQRSKKIYKKGKDFNWCQAPTHEKLEKIVAQLHKEFKIESIAEFEKFVDPVIKKYLDKVEDVNLFLKNFTKVKELFERKQERATDFVKDLKLPERKDKDKI